MQWRTGSAMKKIPVLLFVIGLCASCGGPKLYKKPQDFVGGNKAAAVETHCFRSGGMNQESVAYKLCQESFNTHYGR